MKKIIVAIVCFLGVSNLFAQDYYLQTFRNGNVIYEKKTNEIDSINFLNSSALFNSNSGLMSFPFSQIDSVIFGTSQILSQNDIFIVYNGSSVTVTNPLQSAGVAITVDNAKVTVVSTAGISNIVYHLSGTTEEGFFKITSDKKFTLSLEDVSITSSTEAAINSLIDKTMTVLLSGSSYLSDGAGGTHKAAFYSKGQMIFNGSGTLTVNGNTKHAISSGDYIQLNSGNIIVTSAVSDGLHGDYFMMNGGKVKVTGTTGDCIDGETGFIEINGGTLELTASTADTKALKCDSIMTINNGIININASGGQTKGLKSKQNIYINGGKITVNATGATVMETVDGVNDPSHCTAIAADGEINIAGGEIIVTLPTSNNGGKGIKADGNVNITSGTINITTNGAGAAYTVSGSTKDSYSSSCISSDANLTITGGTITCKSTGSGGKGIRADSAIVIGEIDAADSLLTLNVTTTGSRFTVTSGGGGGWWGGGGPGDNSDYCNPKGIKAVMNLTINSGIITVNCTQSGEGGEGIESKTVLTINGGTLDIRSTGDDALNAKSGLVINGGTTYAESTNNDAIDSNSSLYINGGFTIASASKSPEEAFDCDNNIFGITGGTVIGTAPNSMYSAPTASACTQHVLKYTHASNNAIQILNSDGDEIVTFKIPTISGGGWGGGSSSAVFTFSNPDFLQGTYSLKYGGTISGGTEFHNYYTGASYSGGSNKTFTVGSSYSVTTVN